MKASKDREIGSSLLIIDLKEGKLWDSGKEKKASISASFKIFFTAEAKAQRDRTLEPTSTFIERNDIHTKADKTFIISVFIKDR